MRSASRATKTKHLTLFHYLYENSCQTEASSETWYFTEFDSDHPTILPFSEAIEGWLHYCPRRHDMKMLKHWSGVTYLTPHFERIYL